MNNFDVAIIGGGIVGLSHAWSAAKKNLRVGLFEKTSKAEGASVRNFGMIWPIGQTAGEMYETALKSRELWLELAENGVLEVEQCGSLHLAHHEDEANLLHEFIEMGSHQAEWLRPDQVLEKTNIANSNGLLGGMYSPTELRVDPRTASFKISNWLQEKGNVDCYFNTLITSINGNGLSSSHGEHWTADKILVCSGSDLKTLYPDHFEKSGLRLCKLQMLRTVSQNFTSSDPVSHQKNAHIASGLTLRHYQSFAKCKSLEPLKNRIASQNPELDRYGIHVMASQFPNGEIVLGDSHEYGDDISPFDKSEIDDLIIDELRQVISLDDWTIKEKWHGIYAKHSELPVFDSTITDNVSIFVGTGGAGMTMSFGLADQYWSTINNSNGILGETV